MNVPRDGAGNGAVPLPINKTMHKITRKTSVSIGLIGAIILGCQYMFKEMHSIAAEKVKEHSYHIERRLDRLEQKIDAILLKYGLRVETSK